jgi:predicted dehydrogenase
MWANYKKMKTYRFAILGTGWIAEKMAEALNYVAGAEKYAVASRSMDNANGFAKKWGFAKAYGSYLEAVMDKNVDVVYVATPHNLHFENTMMCLDNGKHVVCEKPLAVNASEVKAMIQKANDKGLFLMEAMWSRFLPHIIKAKEIVSSGQLGHINMLSADFCIQRPYDPLNRKFNRELIGGALLDIGIYPVFLAQYLFGAPKTIASVAAIGPTSVDHSIGMTFGYGDVKLSVLSASFVAESGVNATIYGDNGNIRFDPFWFMPGNFTLVKPDGTETAYAFEKVGNGYHHEIDEVVTCLNAGATQSKLMSWNDSIALIETLDTIRQQCKITYPNHD